LDFQACFCFSERRIKISRTTILFAVRWFSMEDCPYFSVVENIRLAHKGLLDFERCL